MESGNSVKTKRYFILEAVAFVFLLLILMSLLWFGPSIYLLIAILFLIIVNLVLSIRKNRSSTKKIATMALIIFIFLNLLTLIGVKSGKFNNKLYLMVVFPFGCIYGVLCVINHFGKGCKGKIGK